jgi:DNA repair exonuclease SbcCD ATPase subunit
MVPVKELHDLAERLDEKNRELTMEIQLITAWIKDHRQSRPARIESMSSASDERNEYRSWRKVSCRLHQRRSELKTKQEKIREHLQTVARKMEERETGILAFPVFHDVALETDLITVDACA